MFGYVLANNASLDKEQMARYRACYCGLCRTIRTRHGQLCGLSLTYDMTFLILLLDSLYEPEQRQGENRCVVHPVRRQGWRHSQWTDYAADMNVALAYYNCLDDWEDDRNLPRYAYAKMLRPAYRRIQKQWPEACAHIEQCLAELAQFERDNSADLDGAAHCFGRLMAGLFRVKEDFWSDTLCRVGDALGQFIYVMDAAMDEEQNVKKGCYNPIAAFRKQYGDFDVIQALTLLIGECTMAFETLPLEQDLDLLRNILYSGVWTRWVAAHQDHSKE